MLNIYALDKHYPFCALSRTGILGGGGGGGGEVTYTHVLEIIIVETHTGAILNMLRQPYSQDHLFS